MDEEMLTIAQAAKALGVHANTVRAWVRSGKIASTKATTIRGYTYLIPSSALVNPPDPNQVLATDEVTVSSPAPTQFAIDTAVSRIVEPFVTRLQEASNEVGMLRERVKHLESELARRENTRSWWQRMLGST